VYLVKLQAEVRGTGREVELPQLQKAFLTAITEKMLARARLDAEEKFDGLADNELEIILGQKLLKQIVKKAGTAKPSITADEFKKQNGNDKMVVFLSKLNLKIRELSTDDSPEAISAVIELITQLAERKVRFDQGKKAILFDPQSVAAVLKAA
jgi:hypothetical protein